MVVRHDPHAFPYPRPDPDRDVFENIIALVRDAGGDPTAVLRYADRKGLVKRANDERLRRSVRMGKLQTRCVVIEIEV